MDYYRNNPIVLRVTGFKQSPSVLTISRMLCGVASKRIRRNAERPTVDFNKQKKGARS